MSSPLEITPCTNGDTADIKPVEIYYGDMTGLASASRLVRRHSFELTRRQAFGLHGAVLDQTDSLDLFGSLVLAEGRTKPPRAVADQYALVPVMPRDPHELTHSLGAVCSSITTRGNVAFEYDRPGHNPYLDSQIGLVLSYNNRGVALCAGGISTSGPFVRQIQDISRPRRKEEDPEAYLYSSGLRNGFMWRDTLVTAWRALVANALLEVAPDLVQQPTSIQSARNNSWIYSHAKHQGSTYHVVDPRKLARYRNGYDQVAIRLGGRPDHPKGDYVLPMQGVQT